MEEHAAPEALGRSRLRSSRARGSLAFKRQRVIVLAALALLALCAFATGLGHRAGRGETAHRLDAQAREQAALFRERLHAHAEVLHGLATTGERGFRAARREIRLSERFPAFQSVALIQLPSGGTPTVVSSVPDDPDLRASWQERLAAADWLESLQQAADSGLPHSLVGRTEDGSALTLSLVVVGRRETELFAAGELDLPALMSKTAAGAPICLLRDAETGEGSGREGLAEERLGPPQRRLSHRAEHVFQAAGHEWAIILSAPRAFATPAERWLPLGVALGTLTTSALLLLLLHRLLRELEGSERLARSLQDRNAEIQQLALRDPLTGLANRALFVERLAAGLARLEREPERIVAVLFLDLDGFKVVNDALGHACGDELLMQVAHRLRELVRDHDAIARLGGDEFTVLAEEIAEPTEALHFAHRVQDALARPVRYHGHEIRVGVSVGISLSSSRVCDADALLSEADAAMYEAKRGGGHGVCVFDMAARDELRSRAQLEESLPEAIRGGQLEVVYQPVLRLSDGVVTGLEALLRWSRPESGRVSPQVLVAIADSLGLASELLRFVLAQSAGLRPELEGLFGSGVRVWVNLLPRHLAHGCALEAVEQMRSAGQFDPSWLGLEVGTAVPLDESTGVLPAMRRLRELGVRFAVDDFGTGPTSISSLRRLPVDVLKVDPCFIGRLGREGDNAMVAGILRLAGGLCLTTVAEGVETREQADILSRMGCLQAQGHLFCPPLPADELRRVSATPGAAFGKLASGWS